MTSEVTAFHYFDIYAEGVDEQVSDNVGWTVLLNKLWGLGATSTVDIDRYFYVD